MDIMSNKEVVQQATQSDHLFKTIQPGELKCFRHPERAWNIMKEILDGNTEGRRGKVVNFLCE